MASSARAACALFIAPAMATPPWTNLFTSPAINLMLRVLESLAAVVLHGDPADEIDQVGAAVFFVGDNQVVVRVPVHAAR